MAAVATQASLARIAMKAKKMLIADEFRAKVLMSFSAVFLLRIATGNPRPVPSPASGHVITLYFSIIYRRSAGLLSFAAPIDVQCNRMAAPPIVQPYICSGVHCKGSSP